MYVKKTAYSVSGEPSLGCIEEELIEEYFNEGRKIIAEHFRENGYSEEVFIKDSLEEEENITLCACDYYSSSEIDLIKSILD